MTKVQKLHRRRADVPVEVIVEDCLLREKVIAEYFHERKLDYFRQQMYKVYHPCFKETPDNSRWVYHIIKVLGPLGASFEPEAKVA